MCLSDNPAVLAKPCSLSERRSSHSARCIGLCTGRGVALPAKHAWGVALPAKHLGCSNCCHSLESLHTLSDSRCLFVLLYPYPRFASHHDRLLFLGILAH